MWWVYNVARLAGLYLNCVSFSIVLLQAVKGRKLFRLHDWVFGFHDHFLCFEKLSCLITLYAKLGLVVCSFELHISWSMGHLQSVYESFWRTFFKRQVIVEGNERAFVKTEKIPESLHWALNWWNWNGKSNGNRSNIKSMRTEWLVLGVTRIK